MAKKDYYDVLGVERGADEKAIKRAYKNSPCNITLIEPKVIKPKKKNLKKSKKPMKSLGDKESERLTINTVMQPLNKVAWEAVASVADSAVLISVIFWRYVR